MKASTDGCFLKRKGKVEGLKMEKYGVTGNVNNALSIMLQLSGGWTRVQSAVTRRLYRGASWWTLPRHRRRKWPFCELKWSDCACGHSQPWCK